MLKEKKEKTESKMRIRSKSNSTLDKISASKLKSNPKFDSNSSIINPNPISTPTPKIKQNKTQYKRIRLTPQEATIIEEKAKDSGLTLSEYIRRTATGKTVKKRRNLETDKILYQLSKIGANLNQLSKQANIGSYDRNEVVLASRELTEFIKSIK